MVFVVSLLPAAASADGVYTVKIAQKEISDGYYTLVENLWTRYTEADTPKAPYFHYDSANNKLTLNSVTIDTSNDGIDDFHSDGNLESEISIVANSSSGKFIIELIGENKITDDPENEKVIIGPAIEIRGGETTITGEGSLTLSHNQTVDGLLHIGSGNLVIDGAKLIL